VTTNIKEFKPIFVACNLLGIILFAFSINYALKSNREYYFIRLFCHQNYADYVIPKENNYHAYEYDLHRSESVSDLEKCNYNGVNAVETIAIEKSKKFTDCMDNSYYAFAKSSAIDYLASFGILAAIAALIAGGIFFDFFKNYFTGFVARIKSGQSKQH
jgi:hypothetical protein